MAKPFIALDAPATNSVGKQDYDLLLYQGISRTQLHSSYCLDAYPPRPCSSYMNQTSFWSETLNTYNNVSYNFRLAWGPSCTFVYLHMTHIYRKYFEFLEAMRFQVSISSQLQKCRLYSCIARHWESDLARLSVQTLESQKVTRMASPLPNKRAS
jgi:hypothetical protein